MYDPVLTNSPSKTTLQYLPSQNNPSAYLMYFEREGGVVPHLV